MLGFGITEKLTTFTTFSPYERVGNRRNKTSSRVYSSNDTSVIDPGYCLSSAGSDKTFGPDDAGENYDAHQFHSTCDSYSSCLCLGVNGLSKISGDTAAEISNGKQCILYVTLLVTLANRGIAFSK